jgi:DNA-binding SARP family transcriptional activator/DNA-binding XRE family transcriptional regulator
VASDGVDRQRRLGELLREHRNAAGLTQRHLADRAGVGAGTVQDLEQGRTTRSRPGTVARLAAALELNRRERAELTAPQGARRGIERAAPGQPGRDGLRLALLGPFMAWRNGTLAPLGPARQQAVLGMLALHNGTGVSRAAIVDILWGGHPPSTAPEMVQGYVSRIRRLLRPPGDGNRIGAPQPGGGALSWDGTVYRLAPGAVRSDVDEFSALAKRARQAAAAGHPSAAWHLYDLALQLWRGAPLAGIDLLEGHPAVIELSRRRISVVIEYSDAAGTAGRHELVADYLRALAQREPLDERIHARLMIALSALGQQAAALHLYEELRRRLDDELGVRPGPELADAHLRVLRQEFTPATRTAMALDGTAPSTEGTRGRANGPVTADPRVPRQLPLAAPHFVGRAAELSALDRMLGQADSEPGTVLVTTVGGSAGVGKTALAVHWAHQIAGRFPDGQLYVNLHGYGPSRTPVAPAEAIHAFLYALQVPPERIPAGLDARAGLYRSLLAGRRMLVVVDNARDAAQVRPLLPGSPGCQALVTSRDQLTGLAAAEGAHLLTLDVLTEAEAGEMLARRLGSERVAAEPAAATELAGLCARLPLALGIAAARAAACPGLPLAALAAGLRASRARLDGLDTGDAATDVRTVFSWSCQQLTGSAGRMFRLLGVHPGPDITVPAAGSLAGVPPGEARQALAELARTNLITEHAPGRYACHDLLRAYAAEQSRSHDSETSRRAALHRVLDHYLHTASGASLLLHPDRHPITLSPAQPQVRPEEFTGRRQALEWFQAERRVLLAAISLAAGSGFSTHTWQLPWAAAMFFDWQGYWQELAATQESALAAARSLGDRAGQAQACRFLGRAQILLGAYAEAAAHLAAALDLGRQLGDGILQARVHLDLAMVFERQERRLDGLGDAEQALRLFGAAGHRWGQARALNAVGWIHVLSGCYQEALEYCVQALAIHHELGNQSGQGTTLDSIGYVHHHLGQHSEAIACYRQAIDVLGDDDYLAIRATVLGHLGDAHEVAGDNDAARRAWQQALDILGDLHDPAADQMRFRLGRQPADNGGAQGSRGRTPAAS